MSIYYGAKNTRARVEALPPENFEELVRDYIARPRQLSITQQDYHALPREKQQEIKDGFCLNACSFKRSGVARRDANAEWLVALFIDIDDSQEARRLVENPESIHAALPYNYALHHTISSLPDEPRCRLVVDVDPCDPALRYDLVRHVARLTGLVSYERDEEGKVTKVIELFDRISKVASQPAYQPVQFADGDAPLIKCRTSGGKELSESDLTDDDREAGEAEAVFEAETVDSDLEFLPVYGLTVKDVRVPLLKTDPDEPYKWYQTCCALKHQFRTPEEQKEAFELFDEWSSWGEKYDGKEATLRKWKSYKADPKGRTPVTIRSVLKWAREAGWEDSKLLAKQREGFEQWLEEQTDGDVCSTEGIKRIAATPFGDNRLLPDHYVNLLHAKLKNLGIKTGLPKLRQYVATETKKQIIQKRAEDSETGDKEPWLIPWVYVANLHEFHNRNNNAILRPEAFNAKFSRELIAIGSEEQQLTGKPAILPTDYALNIKTIDVADGLTYDPQFGKSMIHNKQNNLTYLNTYQPPADIVRPIDRSVQKAGEMFTQHIKMLAGEDHYKTLMDVFAFFAQHPGQKMRWAVLIQSVPGAGKSILVGVLNNLLGEHNVSIVSPAQVKERFNSWASRCCALVLEEIHVAGENRFAIMNRLKELITNDTMRIERKGQDSYMDKNVANVIAFTNDEDAIAITAEDRRWCVVKSQLLRNEVLLLNEKGYFKDLSRVTHGDLATALVYFLREYPISKSFDPNGHAPHTEWREEMIEDSRNPIRQEIEDCIDDPAIKWASRGFIVEAWLKSYLDQTGLKGKAVQVYLRELGYKRFEENKTRSFHIHGTRTNIWIHKEMKDDYDPREKIRKNIEIGLD